MQRAAEEGNHLWGSEDGRKRKRLYMSGKRHGRSKREKNGKPPQKPRHRRMKKKKPHSPLMLASSSAVGEGGRLPVTLRSEK